MLYKHITLSAIIESELSGINNLQNINYRESALYVDRTLSMLPWFFKWPLNTLIIFSNILSLLMSGKLFFNLGLTKRITIWNKILLFPGYSSMQKLIRTLALLSASS
jgi:hypothetical protein